MVLPCRPQAPFAVAKTAGLRRTNSFCSFGDSFTVAEFSLGYPTVAKIRMTHVRRFNRFRKTQRQFSKFIWRHGCVNLEQLFDPTLPALEKEKAVIQTIHRRAMFQPSATKEAGPANACLHFE